MLSCSHCNNESLYSLVDPDRSRRSLHGQARQQDPVGGGANAVHSDARPGARHAHQGPTLQTSAFEPPCQHLGAHIARQLHLDAGSRGGAARGVAFPIRPPRNQIPSVL